MAPGLESSYPNNKQFAAHVATEVINKLQIIVDKAAGQRLVRSSSSNSEGRMTASASPPAETGRVRPTSGDIIHPGFRGTGGSSGSVSGDTGGGGNPGSALPTAPASPPVNVSTAEHSGQLSHSAYDAAGSNNDSSGSEETNRGVASEDRVDDEVAKLHNLLP